MKDHHPDSTLASWASKNVRREADVRRELEQEVRNRQRRHGSRRNGPHEPSSAARGAKCDGSTRYNRNNATITTAQQQQQQVRGGCVASCGSPPAAQSSPPAAGARARTKVGEKGGKEGGKGVRVWCSTPARAGEEARLFDQARSLLTFHASLWSRIERGPAALCCADRAVKVAMLAQSRVVTFRSTSHREQHQEPAPPGPMAPLLVSRLLLELSTDIRLATGIFARPRCESGIGMALFRFHLFSEGKVWKSLVGMEPALGIAKRKADSKQHSSSLRITRNRRRRRMVAVIRGTLAPVPIPRCQGWELLPVDERFGEASGREKSNKQGAVDGLVVAMPPEFAFAV